MIYEICLAAITAFAQLGGKDAKSASFQMLYIDGVRWSKEYRIAKHDKALWVIDP